MAKVNRRNGYSVESLGSGLREWTHGTTGSKRFTLDYQLDGRQRQTVLKGVVTRTEARRAATDFRSKLYRNEIVAPVSATVGEVYALLGQSYATKIANGERALSSWKLIETRYRCHIKPTLGHRKAQDVTQRDVERILETLATDGKSASTRDGVLDVLSLLFKRAIKEGVRRDNPARMLDPDDRPKLATKRVYCPPAADVAAIIEQAEGANWKLLFQLLSRTGLRISEALGLTWGDLDFEANTISVTSQLEKGGAQLLPLKTPESRRTLSISGPLRTALIAHQLASGHSDPGDFVFATASGRPVSYYHARRAWQAALKRTGIDVGEERFSIHSLRHHFASVLIASGVDIVRVSRALGHAKTSLTLDTYAHVIETATASVNLGDLIEAHH